MQSLVIAFSLMIVSVVVTAAQGTTSGLSGTWTLAADADAGRNRRPITGLSIATQLVIKQSPTEIIVESNTGTGNTMVTTAYNLDGNEHDVPGPIGWETRAKSAWDGKKLEVAITRIVHGPDGELKFDIREVYTAEGNSLTLERQQGTAVQKLVYHRK